MLDFDIWTIVFSVINILVLFFFLKKFLFGRVGAMLEKRAQMVQADMDQAKQKAAELGIAESVQFLGNQGNPQDYYQAMDLFIFPSLYEGLPGTVLEAQAAGLPCLMSDTITQEVALTELVESKSLKDSAESWAQAALALLERQKERFDRMPEIRKAGFDAKEQAKELEAFYRTGKGDGLWNR